MRLDHFLVPLWAASALGSPIWTSPDGRGSGVCDTEVIAAITATETRPEEFCKALIGAGSEIADACKCILEASDTNVLAKRATMTSTVKRTSSTMKTSSSINKASTSTKKASSSSKKASTSTKKASPTSSVKRTSAVSFKSASSSTAKPVPFTSSKQSATIASVNKGISTSASQKPSAASSKSGQPIRSAPTSAASNAAGTIATSAIRSVQKAIQTASFTTISGSTMISSTFSSSSSSPALQQSSVLSASMGGSMTDSASSTTSGSSTSDLSSAATSQTISAIVSSTPTQTTNGINQEILINGGFDDGDIVPWVGAITSNVGLEVTDGLYTTGEALFEHNFVQINRRSTTLLSQDVTMYANDTFRFSSRIIFNYGNGLPEGANCDAAWFINQDYYQMINFNSSNSGAYYDFAVEGLTRSSGSATVNIYMACTSTIRSMDFPVAIDDISLISNWIDPRSVAYTNDSPDARWTQFFNGSGVTQSLLTTGDAASTSLILRVRDASAAIQACAEKTSLTSNKAFDVHFSTAVDKWVCTQFPMAWQSTSLFNNRTEDVTASYGYFLHSENPQNW